MPLLVKARSFLRNLFPSRSAEGDLDEEIQSHLEMLTAEKIRAGLPPEEARREARIALGGNAQGEEQVRTERLRGRRSSNLTHPPHRLRATPQKPSVSGGRGPTLSIGNRRD